jgi:hypothetical protein
MPLPRHLLKSRKAALRLTMVGLTMDPMVVFTRATTARYFDQTYTMQTAASGAARFDWDVNHNPLGLFMEEARTNLCLRSDAPNNASWTKTNTTGTANTDTGPDGTLDYGSLTASAANGTITQAITVVNGSTYVFSIDLKRKTGTGTINISTDGGTTWNAVAVSSTLTRFTQTQVASSTTMTVGVQIVTNGDAVVFGGAQLELGAFVTSRLSTAGSTTVRNRDQAAIALPMPFFPTTMGLAYYIEVQPVNFVAGIRLAGVSDGTPSNEILLTADATGIVTLAWAVNGTTVTLASTGFALSAGIVNKVAASVSPGNLLLAVNGTVFAFALHTADAFAQKVAYTSFDLGISTTGGVLYLRGVRAWRNPLSREHLSALTQ